MNIAAYLAATPAPIPAGIGRVHRMMGDGAPPPKTDRSVSNEEIIATVAASREESK